MRRSRRGLSAGWKHRSWPWASPPRVLAVTSRDGRWNRLGYLAAGLAAAWRPECIGFAFGLAALSELSRPRQAVAAAILVLVPIVAVALIRFSVFGSPAPLSALAKPSDPALGARYSLGAVVFSGIPVFAASWSGLRGLRGRCGAPSLVLCSRMWSP